MRIYTDRREKILRTKGRRKQRPSKVPYARPLSVSQHHVEKRRNKYAALVEQYTTQGLVRGALERMLEVENINYSIPSRFDPTTDTVVDDSGQNIPLDFEAE